MPLPWLRILDAVIGVTDLARSRKIRTLSDQANLFLELGQPHADVRRHLIGFYATFASFFCLATHLLMPRGKPRTRLDEARVAVGDRHREAGSDERPLPRSELDPLTRGEIQPRVALVRPRRQRRLLVEARHGQVGHAPFRRRLGTSSAIRYGA